MLVANMFQVKIGIRNMRMPRARMVRTVVTMFTEVMTPDIPVSSTPAIQRSPPSPGEFTLSLSGA